MPENFSFLKLRGSWAEVGNDTNPFSLSRRADIIRGTLSLNPTQPNENLRPESTNSIELGFDARFLRNRARLGVTWYKSNTSDQIFETPVPSGSGVGSVFQNGADIENRGIEVVLGASIIQTSDFSWDLDVNFSTNTSEVVEIAEGFDVLTISEDFIRQYRLEKGGEFGDVYTRGFLRDDSGNVIVDDLGLPQVTNGFEVQAANFNPDWLGGIRNSFRYKNFNLSALIDIRQGGSIISFTEAILAGNGNIDYTAQGRDGSLVFGSNVFANETAVTLTGSASNTSVDAETFWNRLGGRNSPIGEAFVKDASNIRLREVVLGYTFPEKLLEKTFINSANISFVGRNLFFFSNKAENFDPEAVQARDNEFEGRESFAAPTARSLGLSINLTF